MKLRNMLLIASALLMAGTATADNRAKRLTFSNPIIRKSIPDPSVMKCDDGYFYLYGTEDTRNLPIYRSRNLIDWTFVGTAFTEATRPRTVGPYVAYKRADGSMQSPMMWAPDINYINGQYVLYYSIGVWGNLQKSGVGVATSERPEGPFVDRGCVFLSEDIGVTNSIDQFYIREDGKNYLVWGSFYGIYIVQLTDDGLRVMPGATKRQLAGGLTEASYIYKKDGYYYLFGSAGSCCEGANSTYRVVYGRSSSLFGPYTNKSGGRMLDNQAETLLAGNDFVAGPGHNAEFVDDDKGQTWIIYHGYLRQQADQGRVVFLDQVKWRNGWPYMDNNGGPTQSAQAPYFNEN